MKVYVLFIDFHYEPTDIVDIYLDKHKAEKKCAELEKERKEQGVGGYNYGVSEHEIIE